jgi:hypothetical protein
MKRRIKRLVRKVSGRDELIATAARFELEARFAKAFSRAAATAAVRNITPHDPRSWEFAGFSQHGEDGILDVLCAQLDSKVRFFVEIGAADGLENCSAWLAYARAFGGVMVEGDPALSATCRTVLDVARVFNVWPVEQMVDCSNVDGIMKLCPYRHPDVFVIDIDGIDFYVLQSVMKLGYRPKIIVVEYNSSFGPEQSITIPYQPRFARFRTEPTGLYYGVSIAAWRASLESHGYRFVTVESSGTNAFFVDPAAFQESFLAGIRGTAFTINVCDRNDATRPFPDGSGQLTMPPLDDWRVQFDRIKDMPFVTIPSADR